MWSCLSSFTSMRHLTISDSFLSFPPSPPEIPSVTELSAKRVASQSYEGLLSSLPGSREIDITIDDAERDIPQITAGLRRTKREQLTRFTLTAPSSLPREKKNVSRETLKGLGHLIREHTRNLHLLGLFGMRGLDDEGLVELVESSTNLKELQSLHLENTNGGSFHYKTQSDVQVMKCRLSTEFTARIWSCLRSFTSLGHLIISDSSLSFPPSPPELPSVTKLSIERVTSQSYEGLLSSLPGLREIDLTIDDAERDIAQITAALRRTEGQQLIRFTLTAPSSLPPEKQNVSRETLKGLGHLIREHTKNLHLLGLFGMRCLDDECLVELVESSTNLKSLDIQNTNGGSFHYKTQSDVQVMKCRLSTELTARIWSCLRSFTSFGHLTLSDSSLSFPTFLSDLPSVTKLSAVGVTLPYYLLFSLPGLREIDITIEDVERDIPPITACFFRTQQLTRFTLTAPSSLPPEKQNVSRETLKRLGLLIREQTKSLQWLCLSRVKCRTEQDLVELVKSCIHVKTMNHLMLLECGTMPDGGTRLYTSGLHESESLLRVIALHDDGQLFVEKCQLSSEMTARMWSCLRSFTSLEHLNISDSSLSFPPSPPELPSVTTLSAKKVTSQSYEGLLSSLPGLSRIDITIDDAERDIAQITACLRRTGGQQLTYISLTAPSSLHSEKKSVSRETMRELGQLIREQTKNLQWLGLYGVKSIDEKGLVELVECSRHVKTMSCMVFNRCGTTTGGRLEDHLGILDTSAGTLDVSVNHDQSFRCRQKYNINHTT